MAGITLDPRPQSIDLTLMPQLVERYLEDRALKVKPVTLQGYRFLLDRFLVWLSAHGQSHGYELGRREFRQFAGSLRNLRTSRGELLSPQGQLDTVRRLRQCFRWAYQTGRIPINISDWVPWVKPPRRTKPPIPIDALARLLTAPVKPPHLQIRNRAIVAFLAGTGARREEAANVQIQDLIFDADGSGVAYLGVTKGDKPRHVAFGRSTGRHLLTYLDTVEQREGSLFGLGGKAIYYIVRDMSEAAGVADSITGPHDLRRLFVSYWTLTQPGEGYGSLLSKQVGHEKYSTTQIYQLSDISDVRAAYTSPMEAISPSGDGG